MKVDLQRAEARHAAFAAHGDGHVEIPIKKYVAKYHAKIEFQPLLSLLSGRELAAKVAEKITYLQARIAEAEQEIERLLTSR